MDRGDARLKTIPLYHSRHNLQYPQKYLTSIIKRERTGGRAPKNDTPAKPPTQLPIFKKPIRFAEEPPTDKRNRPSQAALPPEIAKQHVLSQTTNEPHAPPPAIDEPHVPRPTTKRPHVPPPTPDRPHTPTPPLAVTLLPRVRAPDDSSPDTVPAKYCTTERSTPGGDESNTHL